MTDSHDTIATDNMASTGDFFQVGDYAPVADELTEFDLPIEGALPAELDGWYLRNGPNPRQATAHWFTGDGMIHGVRIEGGRASGTATDGYARTASSRTSRSTTPTARATCAPALPTRTWSTMRANVGAGGVVAALRDHQRSGNRRARTTSAASSSTP